MPNYIDIENLPNSQDRGRWVEQIEEWKKIPLGKALEIKDVIKKGDTYKAHATAANINTMLSRKNLPELHAEARRDRLFILRVDGA